MAIRTPDQRLRVFVSSTLLELADERAVVARAISALGLTPVLFELGANVATAKAVIAHARTAVERAAAAMPQWFGRLPKTKVLVTPVPLVEEPTSSMVL